MSLAEEIESLVETIEAESSAEVVVCLQDRAGRYADLDMMWAGVVSIFLLSYSIWSPQVFHPDWVVPNTILAGAIGYALSRWMGLRRLFLTEQRIRYETERASLTQFHLRGVRQTRDRVGLLVYVARYERRMILVPDSGLEPRLSSKLWKSWASSFGDASSDEELLENLKAQLHALAGPCRRQCPRREDDIDELPNAMVET